MTIAVDYRRGASIPEIMKKYGVCRQAIYNELDSAGIPRRKRKVTQKDIDAVCNKYYERVTIVDIARRLGLTKQRVHYIIAAYYEGWLEENLQ